MSICHRLTFDKVMRIMRQRFLWPDALLLYPGLELAGEYQKVNPQVERESVWGMCSNSMIYGSETWAVNAEQEAKT